MTDKGKHVFEGGERDFDGYADSGYGTALNKSGIDVDEESQDSSIVLDQSQDGDLS